MTTRNNVASPWAMWLLAALALLPLAGRTARADAIPWTTGYDAAQTQARSSGKLLMVDVYTDWCGWCKKLDEDVYPKPAVIKAAGNFLPVRLNAEKEGKAVADKYHVTGYPTILFLTGDGTLVSQIGGYEEADKFAADLDRIGEENRQLPAWEAAVKADPTDRATALKLARAYVHRGRLAEAQALAAGIEKSGGTSALGPLYNEIGDAQAGAGQMADAIASYRKTLAASKTASDLVDAHVGLFQCYAQEKDTPRMKAQLQALLDLPGAPASLKARAKAMLTRLQAASAAP